MAMISDVWRRPARRRDRRRRVREAVQGLSVAMWLSRKLWRPLAADVLGRRPVRRGRRHMAVRMPWAAPPGRRRPWGARAR